ncbi:MAG: DUF3604 domain-containing protein [Deltaproteobacteria bacterium]|nr:DUF3604 domain-containing protein [Deltaproteobacteria bacterium]
MVRILVGIAVFAMLLTGLVWLAGTGRLAEDWHAGAPQAPEVTPRSVAVRAAQQREAAFLAGVSQPKQILFGDLHVHSTFSTDAFLASLPLTGGQGMHPVSDACDFARHCAALDFWSINDHAQALTPRRWNETVEAVRACNEVAGDAANPDSVAYLGWEWTQVGDTPDNHYGHKNVILRDLADGAIPLRPISAMPPAGTEAGDVPSAWGLGLGALLAPTSGGLDMARYFQELLDTPDCASASDTDCIERAATPRQLFDKLDALGHASLVIPHGTTWGFYTPPGSSWEKQLTPEMHDPERQTLVEVYSGHGNSEEYRAWRDAEFASDGSASCPEPRHGYEPSCWRAGEIIRMRCAEDGEETSVCEERAVAARQHYVDAGVSGFLSVPGQQAGEWSVAGQCRDCFQPAFNYRPLSSAQYMMALSNFDAGGDPLRFRFGFMASSDNHSARPGTGYKEFWRREMTEQRFGEFENTLLAGNAPSSDPEPESVAFDRDASPAGFFGLMETERQASFFLTGGLIAAHSEGRDRGAVWDAMARREVYGTSGPKILLWFDHIDPTTGRRLPMGSEFETDRNPAFQVRALGSFEQQEGCPAEAEEALGEERLAYLCGGECDNPSTRRRAITRVEVVRIRPQSTPGESLDALIEDPWKVLPCTPDEAGCRVTFRDSEYETFHRDTVYYVRAIEEPSQAVDYDGVACLGTEVDDDCLGETEQRAWSSPIFVDWLP